MDKYPLLVRGRTLPEIAPGAQRIDTGVFISGRGNCVKIDALYATIGILPNALQTINVGGQNVIQDIPAGQLRFNTYPGQFINLVGKFGENQTFQLVANNGSTIPVNYAFLEYYENRFDTPKIRQLLNADVLSTKQISFNFVATAATSRREQFIVPKNRGKIFAVVPFVDRVQGANPAGQFNALFSANVNGINIIENVTALNFTPECSRQRLFPIEIEPGSTLTISIDNTAGGVDVFGGLTLFFVPSENC